MSERDYVRPGGVNVEPESLEQFSEWMGNDYEALQEAYGSVEQDCFGGILQPYVFAGETTEDAALGLPEAVAYHRAYSELETAMRIVMMQIQGGLMALQTGASFVHMTYSFSDGFGASQVTNPFAAYSSQDVGDVFAGNGMTMGQLQAERDAGTIGDELPLAEERWQEELEDQQGVDVGAEIEADDSSGGTDNPERPPEVRYYDRVQHTEVEMADDQASLDVPGSFPTRDPQPHPTAEEEDD